METNIYAMALSRNVSVDEALSGIFGSISLTAWICLLLPQLIANYKAKSAEGLSMGFLLIWLFGDVANLCGALVTGLAPTATALAGYFCISDLILITQCVYYNVLNARRAARARRQRTRSTESADAPSEDEPLLRRSTSNANGESKQDDGPKATRNKWLSNCAAIAGIYIVGAAGWLISYNVGAWDKPDDFEEPRTDDPVAIGGMVLGYASALCYLCARIPQIVKNHKEKSCEGLALLFFLFSLTGNLTYGLSVFAYSQDADYLIKAVPWLLGSLGTIVEDCIIFYQFRLYSTPAKEQREGNGVYDGQVEGVGEIA
ncbi:PQ-loop-domain-containing protein [Xylariomycetidae sp. FL0641]|nr:PQ-loop-domain-containing protein [Xylariomycetidae sp. FL0641]